MKMVSRLCLFLLFAPYFVHSFEVNFHFKDKTFDAVNFEIVDLWMVRAEILMIYAHILFGCGVVITIMIVTFVFLAMCHLIKVRKDVKTIVKKEWQNYENQTKKNHDREMQEKNQTIENLKSQNESYRTQLQQQQQQPQNQPFGRFLSQYQQPPPALGNRDAPALPFAIRKQLDPSISAQNPYSTLPRNRMKKPLNF